MIIDIHVHLAVKSIYPDYWLDGTKKQIAEKIKADSDFEVDTEFLDKLLDHSLNDFDCSRLITQMDEADIEKAVILLVDFGFSNDDNISLDEIMRLHYEATYNHKDRLLVFAGIDPRRGARGIDLFEKSITEFGFSGLKIYPPCGFEIDDPLLYPLYEICAYHHLPVLTHIGPSLQSMKNSFNYPESILKVSGEFRDIDFILGHAAVIYYEESRNLPLKRENIFLETSGFQKIFDQEERLKAIIKGLCDICPEHIVFGTDWPIFNYPKQCVKYFQQLDCITDSQKEKILGKNAAHILNRVHKS